MKYPFLVLEGCDGSGKTTLREALARYLISRGMPVATIGQHSWLDLEASRTIIDVRERRRSVSPEMIAKSYFVDKRMHALHNVSPQLKRSTVLADRWIFSDAVYQEALYGMSARTIMEDHITSKTLLPDVCIWVDVPSAVAYSRVVKRVRKTRHYENPLIFRSFVKDTNGYLRMEECLAVFLSFTGTILLQ
jgi:thymidylate kinase